MDSRMDGSRELRGSMTALVTPFRNGEVDWECLDRLVDRQMAGGTDWLVPCGTTGEAPTLTEHEYERVAESVIARSAGRHPVMIGTGSNSTAEAVRRTKFAASIGAGAALIVTPYYNRPTQEGLFRHYAAIAEAVELPLVLYNVPLRTGVNLGVETVARLRRSFPHVGGVKHATGSVDGVTELLEKCDVVVLCGDDPLTWPMMCLGAKGVISVVGNLEPEWMHTLVESARDRDFTAALRHHRQIHALAAGLGAFGPNPVPIKTAMSLRGLIHEEFRLPLCPLDEPARQGIERLIGDTLRIEAVAA